MERGGALPPPPPPHALHAHAPLPHLAPLPPPPHLVQPPAGALPPPPHVVHHHPHGGLPVPPTMPLPLPPPPPPAAPRALPPPPPAGMLTGAGSAPADAWRVYRSGPPDDKEYYFNTLTERAQWQKPQELVPEHERELPPCDWEEFKTDDGITYFANRKSGISMWSRPQELIDYETAKEAREKLKAQKRAELAAAAAAADSKTPAKDLSAQAFETKLKDNQAKLLAKKAKKAAAAAAYAAATAGPTAEPSAAMLPASEPATAAVEEGEAVASSSPSLGAMPSPGAAVAPAGGVGASTEEPVYATKDDARAAFRQLLVDKRITSRMKNFNVDVLPLIGSDVRYRALKTLPERKKAYLSYLEEVVKTEAEARRAKEAALLADCNELLVETVEIDSKSRFKTSVQLLEMDERYRALHTFYLTERAATGNNNLQLNLDHVYTKMENIFYKHVDTIIQKEKQAAAAKRTAQAEAFKQLLRDQTEISALEPGASAKGETGGPDAMDDDDEEGAIAAEAQPVAPRWINGSTSWRQVKKRAEFTSDPRWLDGPAEADAFELFEGWMAKLAKFARDKAALAKEARRAVEKEKRRDFRALLTEEADKGNLHGRSRWKEVLPFVQDDARYTALIDWYMQSSGDASSSSSGRDRERERDKSAAVERIKDLFLDFVAELADRHEPIKRVLKGTVLKDLHITVLPTHTPEQLTSLAQTHPQWSSLTSSMRPAELSAVWRELVTKVQLKVHYFHSRQKAEQIRLVGKMLRNLFAAKIAPTADAQQLLQEADSIDFERCKSLIADLQQPELVSASPAVAAAPAEEPEEGAVEEEGEVPDAAAAAVAAPRLVAKQHPAHVSAGLAAWRLLECPPIPAPDAQVTTVPTAPLPPYTTDEFVREAVDAFKAQWKAELAAGSVPRPEEDKPATRKRRRSGSRSRSASRTRTGAAAAKKTTSSSSSSTRPSSSSKAARSPSRSSHSPKRQRDTEEANKNTNGTSAAAFDGTATAATTAATAAAATAMQDDEPEEGEL